MKSHNFTSHVSRAKGMLLQEKSHFVVTIKNISKNDLYVKFG